MLKSVAVLMSSCGVLLAGCGPDSHDANAETVANLLKAGFRAEDITVVDGAVHVGGDAHVPLAASREMLQPGEGSQEHYRSANLVGPNVTTICVHPSSEFSGNQLLYSGLLRALTNYNMLGLRLRFLLGTSTGCDATISARTMRGTGHSAGQPSGGLPYGVILIGTGLSDYGVYAAEHVITHALGHTIGLRHTDYYNPNISCSTGGGGGPGEPTGVGAIHIPGTPTTATPGGSIMNTCFPLDTTGNFTSTDIAALNALY
ncbi:M57 family metalloprotease [Corallococcus macrosporus]|uniref:Protease n=1 Tax=Corallococcus macrosporus DSM 14697 TaxID=1189310 RepID=A0A250JRT5_9BACT|nr:M57 family metalloprotease [Corallococcus macrosporus]ATB46589.1 protease [Corallococcus macrosporus DSM 14697]